MKDFEVVNENLRVALRAFSAARPSGAAHAAEGHSLTYSGAPLSLFNTALLTAPPAYSGFDGFLRSAASWFEQHQTSWSVWFCDNFLTGDQRRLSRIALAIHELKHLMEAPGMLAPRILPPDRALPPIECLPVCDSKTRDDFGSVMAAGFKVPADASSRVYTSETLWGNGMQGWVGYFQGRPVSTTCTVLGADAIGIYAVSTHPDHQRRGYAEALMRHAIADAQQLTGIPRTVLQSSNAGYSLYVRMGYRPVARYFVYTRG